MVKTVDKRSRREMERNKAKVGKNRPVRASPLLEQLKRSIENFLRYPGTLSGSCGETCGKRSGLFSLLGVSGCTCRQSL